MHFLHKFCTVLWPMFSQTKEESIYREGIFKRGGEGRGGMDSKECLMILKWANTLGTSGQEEIKPSANPQLLPLSTQIFLIKKNLGLKWPLALVEPSCCQSGLCTCMFFLLQTYVHICISLLLVSYVKPCAISASLHQGEMTFFEVDFLCRTRATACSC